MSTTADTGAGAAVHDDPHAGGHAHPSDLTYVKVALFLGILTALEVSTYWWGDVSAKVLAAVLVPLMTIKFGMVAAFFMHLKFDPGLFTRMFVAGLAFAVGVYCVMLTAFRFW